MVNTKLNCLFHLSILRDGDHDCIFEQNVTRKLIRKLNVIFSPYR